MKIFVTIIAAILLVGCWPFTRAVPPRPPVLETPTTVTPDTSDEHARVETAEEEVNRLRGELASAEGRVETAKANERLARLSGIRTLVTWLTALCVLFGVLSMGAAIIFRSKTFIVVTGACAAMAITAQATHFLFDHPVATGVALALLITSVVVGLWAAQRHTQKGLVAAIEFGRDAMVRLPHTTADVIKNWHATKQENSGVKPLIDRTLKQCKGMTTNG